MAASTFCRNKNRQSYCMYALCGGKKINAIMKSIHADNFCIDFYVCV